MKNILTLSAIFAGSVALAACGGATNNTNVNVHTNSNGSTMGNGVNTVSNTASSAVNTVANTAASMTTPSPDDFMKNAADGGMAEVEMGKLATKNAQDPEVKKFGQMMVDDHTKANTELKALAAKKNVTLPTDMGSYKGDVDDLSKLKGADFDKEYVDHMVDDHEDDVAAFEKQANNGTDPDVKAFAAKTLPVLRKHLDAIKAIQAKMNK
jgi:putative membrane protein